MFKFSRILVAYAVAIPLALTLGYLVSSPENRMNLMVIGTVLFFLALPFFLKWHHVLLIVFWNSVFNAFFLPSQPDFWLPFAGLSFGISFLNHIMFQKKFLHAPEMTRPLLFFVAVVLVTAECRGGIGIKALGGSTYGGRYYIFVLGAIMGYYAFSAEQIPVLKGRKMASLFFLSGTSAAISNIIYLFPPLYFLYYLVPAGTATFQAASDLGISNIDRIAGFGSASIFALCFLLARYGIRGLFEWAKPWRFFFLCLTFAAAGLSGFRSVLVMLCIIFTIQFYFEGLYRTHYLPIVLGLALCGFIPILFFSSSMPSGIQRAISFLPVNVDPETRLDAQASSEWRYEMWSVVMKEVPKYLLIGKGYAIDPELLRATVEGARLGANEYDFEGSLIAGDYHNGPLSVLIPFGIIGMVAFLWVLIAGYRVLQSNYRYGDPRLRQVNRVLLVYYISECFAFFFIFGALSTQLTLFMGVCGLSVSLNGGVKRKSVLQRKPISAPQSLAMTSG